MELEESTFLTSDYITMLQSSIQSMLHHEASLMAQMGKNLPAMQETQIQSLGWEDPRKEGVGHFSSILVWKLPTDRGTGGLQSMGVTKSQTQLSKHSTLSD